MAAKMSRREVIACFDRCYKKLLGFVFKEDDGTKASLNLLLDELIALDCSALGTTNEAGSTILKKLSILIPHTHERLVTKVCHIIHNFLKYKLVCVLARDASEAVTEFLVQSLRVCSDWAVADLLRAVAAMMEDYSGPFFRHEDLLLGKGGILVAIVVSTKPEVSAFAEATHCLKCLAIKTAEKEGLSQANAVLCLTTLIDLLHRVPSLQVYNSLQCRLLVEALQGINSLVVNAKVPVEPHLGRLLAAIKGYMFQGLGEPVAFPPELFPTITSGYDTKSPSQGAATPSAAAAKADHSTTTTTPTTSIFKTKSKKSRKKKGGGGASNEETNRENTGNDADERTGSGVGVGGGFEPFQMPTWPRWGSSDSEFSDSDAGQSGVGGKGHLHCTRVRIASFSCLASVCKLVDKRAMFGYWSFFIPDSAAAGNSPQVHSLFTVVLRDPSPKCRMGALVSLTAMLDGTKQFLAAAEESSNVRTAFTPLSSVLGAMIREMHRALLQALVVENYNLTLTQLIKCLSTLVVNVPYHRLQPGLLSRVVKQLRHFLAHKDSNVKVACLTCLGAMVSHQPPLMEVLHIVQSPAPPVGMTTSTSTAKPLLNTINTTVLPPYAAALSDSGIDTHSTSSPGSGSVTASAVDSLSCQLPAALSVGPSSGAITPTLGASSPGIHTPVFTDQMLQAQAQGTSWLIKLCLKHILPQPTNSSTGSVSSSSSSGVGGGGVGGGGGEGGSGRGGEEGGSGATTALEPLPVRLESLQVLANLCKGYFPVIRGQLRLMQGLIMSCLEDQDPTIKLHGCKVLEELGAVMMKEIQDAQNAPPSTSPPTHTITLEQVQQLWQSVMEGPLLDILQDSKGSNPVRASACDSLTTIGPLVFSSLTREQQQQCLSLALQLTQSSDRLVVSAGVRALGVFVLYPCLSPNVSFVADAANAMLKCIKLPSINVKIKAAWALGNLCDALVVNKDNKDAGFVDQFSDLLLSTMLNAVTAATQDSDKVKCNAVRAVGNILRYLPHRSLGKSHMVEAVRNSVKVIIKTMSTGPMKVRWNSCYAMANMMKNPLLFTGETSWLTSVLTALSQVVKDCKNFKVRINAALALAVPSERRHYGDVTLFCLVWTSLVESLATTENITDFAEFRYKDSLTEQVCQAVLHMLSMSEAEDVCGLLGSIQSLGPVLQHHMTHFVATNNTNTLSAMKLVRQRLVTLSSDTALISEDLGTGLQLLREICLLDMAQEDLELTPPRLTAFRQIYD